MQSFLTKECISLPLLGQLNQLFTIKWFLHQLVQKFKRQFFSFSKNSIIIFNQVRRAMYPVEGKFRCSILKFHKVREIWRVNFFKIIPLGPFPVVPKG